MDELFALNNDLYIKILTPVHSSKEVIRYRYSYINWENVEDSIPLGFLSI